VETYKQKYTKLQISIFRLLCIKADLALNQSEIAEVLDATPSGVAKALRELKKDKLIIVKKHDRINLIEISLNRTTRVMRLKQIENLKQIYSLNLIEFLEESFPGTTIILFGSYSKGEDIVTSDIDIAIIGSKEKEINRKSFEKKLERQININFYEHLGEIDKELKENICNGIVLSGGIDL